MARGTNGWASPPRDTLRVGPGFRLADLDRSGTPGWPDGRRAAADRLAALGVELSELQEMLHANGRKGDGRSVLLVLQGLDTAGKGGVARHVLGLVDPQGVVIRGFGAPTAEEKARHFLWRIRAALPPAGKIGVFDRSHYEDVLVVRVEGFVPPEVWEERYEEINAFEAEVSRAGTTIVKCALLISHEEQGARLLERLARPEKHWKYNPGDIATRLKWDAYQEAYQAVFERTSTEAVPWFAVPADHKWYARLAIAELLADALRGLGLAWPAADFDVEAEKARLAATMRHPDRRSIERQDRDENGNASRGG